jgi:diketogulonate reductase-like aldo/keto reductase
MMAGPLAPEVQYGATSFRSDRAGRIRSWGGQQLDVRDLDEAERIAGKGRIACDQVLYHLRERAIEHAVIPACEAKGAAVIAYSPFGSGNFPGRDTPGGRVLREIAAAHDATPRQVALRFLNRRRSVFAIPKASRPEHAAENAAAAELKLSDEEIGYIDRAFPLRSPPGELPTL